MPPLILPTILGLAVIGAAVIVILAFGFYFYTSDTQVAADPGIKPSKEKKKSENLLNKIADLLGKPFSRLVRGMINDQRAKSIRLRIEAAGRPENLTVEGYAQRRAGEFLLYGILGLMFFMQGLTILTFVVIPFMFLTDLQLYTLKRDRQDKMQRQLPDFLDVLSVVVGSGLSFRQALQRVADTMPGVCADEFQISLQQMDLGTSRREAFNALRQRNNNESLGKFVSAIIQAEELGAPLSQALQEISGDMRRDDAQYMRRKAQKVNPSITAITMGTLLPGMLLLVAGGMIFGIDFDLGSIGSLGG